MKISQLLKILNELAPFRLAESWDKVGLQIGDPNENVRKLLVCLEVTETVIAEAVRTKANCILAHHPLIFKPMDSLRTDRYQQRLVSDLVRHKLSLIVAHTNLDSSPVGTNTALAELLGLEHRRLLIPGPPEKYFKFVVFVPEGHEDQMIEAIHRGGGGVIGDYDHCTARGPVIGTFRPQEGANPYIGKSGELEHVKEFRLETVVPEKYLYNLIHETRETHPYEEMAYDIYPLYGVSEEWGLGLIGMLPKRAKLRAFVSNIKKMLGVDRVMLIGSEDDISIKTIAVFAGSCKSVIRDIRDKNFDVLVTGEIDYHHAQEALAYGLNIICVGHYASERPVTSYFSRILERQPLIAESKLEILASQSEFDPIRIL